MAKYDLHFDPHKPHVFIESVKDVIETQYRNEDRDVFGKGLYQLRKGFEHFLVNDLKWSSITVVQRLNKVMGILKIRYEIAERLCHDHCTCRATV